MDHFPTPQEIKLAREIIFRQTKSNAFAENTLFKCE